MAEPVKHPPPATGPRILPSTMRVFANPAQPNWYGLWTLYCRETLRFIKVWTQTLLGPVITSLLFLAVFALALGRSDQIIGGMPYIQFLAPGLIMMAVAQNAYANTSSSIFVAKMQGNIVDALLPPLSANELAIGFALAGVTRGVLIAYAVGLAMSMFVPLGVHALAVAAFYVLAGGLMLALLGLMTAIWAEKYDQLQAVTNFVITPLAFLSGSFYSIERLPEGWLFVAHANPFFYMIDGFRYGLTGHAEGSFATGAVTLVAADIVLWLVCRQMLAKGYRLKA
ncbi:MAG: ABC transporter permease [Proteobacteria bacterium]|nr:ABC transporter permease [Pseudomonadota bacterium]